MAKAPKLKLKSWYSSKYQVVVFQRNILFFISFFAITSVLIAVIFVRQIMASKSLIPYVIEIEDKTGIPIVLEQLNQSSWTADANLKRYFIYSFIKASQGYNPSTFTDDLRKLNLFSTPQVFRQVQAPINPRNEKSPRNLIGTRGAIEVALKSISFPSPTSAVVRFRLRNVGNVSSFANNRDMIADIQFRFANLELSLEQRTINPIGFQVTKFVVDTEIILGYEERR